MSAQQPPTPDELVEQLGLTPEEAQAVADAMTPLQDITGVGASVGSALEGAPGAGPQLIGTVLQNIANQVNLASTSVESVARAFEFYIEAQNKSIEQLFPPPSKIAENVSEDVMPLVEAIDRLAEQGQPPEL